MYKKDYKNNIYLTKLKDIIKECNKHRYEYLLKNSTAVFDNPCDVCTEENSTDSQEDYSEILNKDNGWSCECGRRQFEKLDDNFFDELHDMNKLSDSDVSSDHESIGYL